MAILRPAVNPKDPISDKIVKYIPAEIMAAYSALIGGFVDTEDPKDKTLFIVLVSILIVINPLWTYFATYDQNLPNRVKRALFHAMIAFLAFFIWIYVDGNAFLIEIIGKDYYKLKYGSIALILFTLSTPLLARLILKDPLLNQSIKS